MTFPKDTQTNVTIVHILWKKLCYQFKTELISEKGLILIFIDQDKNKNTT